MKSLTNIWNRLLEFYAARHEPENMRPLAEWYWRTLLTVTLFGLIGILVFGVWDFYAIMRRLSAGQNLKPSEQPALLSRAELQELLTAFEKRSASFEAAKSGSAGVSDPSR